MGGPIFPASGEIGSSSREPPHNCLVPRGELVLHPHLERFCFATEGLGGGARGRGQGRYCELTSERGGAARRVFEEFWGPIGAFAYLAHQAWLRGFRSAPGAEPEAGPRAGLGQPQGVRAATEEKSVSPASAGVGGRREGTGLRKVNWFPPGARFPALLRTTSFFFPLGPRLRGFRSAAGAGPGRDQGGAASGLRQEDGIELAARPWASSRPPEDKKGSAGVSSPHARNPVALLLLPGRPGPSQGEAARAPAPVSAPSPSSRAKLWLACFPIILWFCHFLSPDLRPSGSITKIVRSSECLGTRPV